MNFFEAQDKARRNTSWLILLFILAVSGLVLLTNLLLLVVLAYFKTYQLIFSFDVLQSYFSWEVFIGVTVGICLLIFSGSMYKTMSLSGGGSSVAEMLGGCQVPQSTSDLHERRLLNVVEEMAIASGVPVPRVYLLDDQSINAFAAGQTHADAVIGVTRGTLMRLSREELQGVIAHEFSHIFNGDMRLNIRLIGVLHGILLIGLIGYFIVRSLRFSRRSSNSKSGGGIAIILVLGLGLMVIGYTGTFFGQWIKAVVSRQREYLADSSAVQFTRNKDSIAGALKKIGGSNAGSYIEAPAAPEYSHAYFANGIRGFWQSLFATHPPLDQRIKRVDSRWDGKYVQSEIISTPQSSESAKSAASGAFEKLAVTAAILTSAEQAISQVGTLNEENIEYVHELIIAMPVALRTASQDAFSARALVYAILISKQNDKKEAWSLLEQHADQRMPALTRQLFSEVQELDEKFKLPLLELGINALRDLSSNQFIQFKRAVQQIIAADKMVDLNEWIIQRLVLQQLDQHFGFRKQARAKYASLSSVKNDAETILSLIAYVEHKSEDEAKSAFKAGIKEVGASAFDIIPRKALKLDALNSALDNLMRLKPLAKPRFLKACVAIILADGKTTTNGIELVRTISTCLDCPMPPLSA